MAQLWYAIVIYGKHGRPSRGGAAWAASGRGAEYASSPFDQCFGPRARHDASQGTAASQIFSLFSFISVTFVAVSQRKQRARVRAPAAARARVSRRPQTPQVTNDSHPPHLLVMQTTSCRRECLVCIIFLLYSLLLLLSTHDARSYDGGVELSLEKHLFKYSLIFAVWDCHSKHLFLGRNAY